MQVANEGRGAGLAGVVILVAVSAIAALGETPVIAHEVRTAVTRDGFVASEQVGSGRRVTEVTSSGSRSTSTYARSGDVRIVGATDGVIAVYEENKRVRLERVSDRRDRGIFGKSIRMLCEGVASSDTRFGVGWLESDDNFWYVHGPVTKNDALDALEMTRLEPDIAAQAATKEWCGIASAEDKVALLWRDRDRLFVNMCTKKKCAGLAGAMKLEREVALLGVGCLRNACLLALRERGGKTVLTYMTESGSAKWTKPLEIKDTHVSIVGAGNRAFAVGTGNRVIRVEKTGAMRDVWTGPGDGVPQVSWAAGKLFVARANGGSVTTDIVEMAK